MKIRLRETSMKDYAWRFKRFARDAQLEQFTRKQLATGRGKALILNHLQNTSKASWRPTLAMLRTVWVYGLNLPWPIDVRTDIPRLPHVKRGESPEDGLVKKWADALQHETDPYLQLVWLLIAQHGWRPSHAAGIRWSDIRNDLQGRPAVIVAYGTESTDRFKTSSPVGVKLSPAVIDALEAWKRAQKPFPEDPVLPWSSKKGKPDPKRIQDNREFGIHWHRLALKWGLPPLRPKDLRHWTAGVCRRVKMSKQASALMMGHDSTRGGSMRDLYDNAPIDQLLEEQAQLLPKGTLGFLEPPPKVELLDGVPSDAIQVLKDYLEGHSGVMDVISKLEDIRTRPKKVEQLLAP
jgi:integrase